MCTGLCGVCHGGQDDQQDLHSIRLGLQSDMNKQTVCSKSRQLPGPPKVCLQSQLSGRPYGVSGCDLVVHVSQRWSVDERRKSVANQGSGLKRSKNEQGACIVRRDGQFEQITLLTNKRTKIESPSRIHAKCRGKAGNKRITGCHSS
jgi:hypothetical protein